MNYERVQKMTEELVNYVCGCTKKAPKWDLGNGFDSNYRVYRAAQWKLWQGKWNNYRFQVRVYSSPYETWVAWLFKNLKYGGEQCYATTLAEE